MRRFVVVGHRAITSSKFNLNDLCGATGRLDVLLRCINSAFFLSHDIRRDVELYLILQGEPEPPKTIRLVGDELKYLNPDERSTAALIRNALIKKIGKDEEMSTPGIYISKNGLEEVIKGLAKNSTLVYLREDGGIFEPTEKEQDYTFILSDDKDMDEKEEALLKVYEPEIVSLGSISYHSDHCIVIVNNLMDRFSNNSR
ncbi:MAG: tRNA (pseudouridine(54)-N(1))-methyltransferase TrmY [Thermoplasmata archaeon]|nr:MAG: tRNA (pseudouridine(54)-N(1))-methyltransferase TrmY [Thermoplasmata archaeon]